MLKPLIVVVVLLAAIVDADYQCLCNYNVEMGVLPTPSSSAIPIGYLYEFDCKGIVHVNGLGSQFTAIAFEHKLGYVTVDANVQKQTCPGDPPAADIITTTPQPPPSTVSEHTTGFQSSLPTQPKTYSTTAQSTTPQSITTLVRSTTSASPQTTTKLPTTSAVPQTTSTQPTTSIVPQTTSTQPKLSTNTVNTTGSPLAYIGIGYNLLTGNPSPTSHLKALNNGRDQGLLYDRRIFQLTPANGTQDTAREVDVRTQNTCNYTKGNYFVHDGKTYQNELLTLVDLHDTEFIIVRQQTQNGGNTVYIDSLTSCAIGEARYKEELASSSGFLVSREFAADVCGLPLTYNTSQYMQFLDTWGTNIVISAKFGSFSLRRYRTTPLQVLLHTGTQRNRLFNPSGKYDGYDSSVTINSTELSKLGMAPFGSLISEYHTGSHAQEAVQITLSPIATALEIKYWTGVLNRQWYMGICKNMDTPELNDIRENMHMALQQYATYKTNQHSTNSQPLTDVPLTIPLTWPFGTYGLLESSSGCPGDKVSWQHGHRKFDTEDTGPHNYFTSEIQHYMAGQFSSNDITINFCMKLMATTDTSYNHDWPAGTYCTLKKGNCPIGFASGNIHWDDDDWYNHNSAGGSMPDGHYTKNTDMYFCCRNDGSPSQPILLPRDKPFILFRFGLQCQSVFDMQVHELFIRWDDEDVLNGDSGGGAHPYDDGGSKDHKLHFCYYHEQQGGHSPVAVG